MVEHVIEVKDLVKKYNGRKVVLDGVSFSVDKGDFLMIYGKSGCGKTTLLNILGGLDRPTSGSVVIDGESISTLPEDELAKMRLEKMGFVFQDFNLLMDLTVRENISLPLRFSGKEDGGRIDKMMEKFDITPLANETANKISGGEAQRVAIVRAMMNEPKIILADEPTGNLDSENTENVLEMIEMVRRHFGATIVLATHDRDLADYATAKVFLENGKTAFERSTDRRQTQ